MSCADEGERGARATSHWRADGRSDRGRIRRISKHRCSTLTRDDWDESIRYDAAAGSGRPSQVLPGGASRLTCARGRSVRTARPCARCSRARCGRWAMTPWCRNRGRALRAFAKQRPDVLILDIGLPTPTGATVPGPAGAGIDTRPLPDRTRRTPTRSRLRAGGDDPDQAVRPRQAARPPGRAAPAYAGGPRGGQVMLDPARHALVAGDTESGADPTGSGCSAG
jgi:hypothetical protein